MRPTFQRLSALGVSPWVPINYLQIAFGVGLGVIPDSGSTLTYTVQHTFGDLSTFHPIQFTQSATTVTVEDNAHNLSVGDSVIIQGSGINGADGTQVVASIVNANSYTFTSGVSQIAVSQPSCVATNLPVFPHISLVGLTTRADGNYAYPIGAIRLSVTAYTSGAVNMYVYQSMGR